MTIWYLKICQDKAALHDQEQDNVLNYFKSADHEKYREKNLKQLDCIINCNDQRFKLTVALSRSDRLTSHI